MASEPAPQLRIVDTATGEISETCPNCRALADQLDGAENNVRSMRAQMANLKRELDGDLDTEAKLFPEAVALFRYWQERCRHPKTEFTPDRMKLLLPLLKRHGPELCREAIRGAEFDPFITTRKNGNRHRHDGWDQIFRGEDKFQDYRARAPEYDGRDHFRKKAMVDHAREVAAKVLERARLIDDPKSDPVSIANLLVEINTLNHRWRNARFENEDA
jgi:hypothetical protein